MNKTSNKDEEIIPNLFSREFDFIRTVTQEVKRHDVFLDTDIGEPQNYRDLITLLFNANENDSINIFINSQGGHLNSALAIIEGIKHSNAQVTGIIMGECYSAASMIALNCHNVVVLDSANMMIHTASFGTAGNTSNVKAYTDFTVKEVEKLLVSTYEGFLTSEEIDKIKTGVEIWLSAEDISKRMEIRVKLLEAKEQEVAAPTPEPKKPTRRKKQ
jgi:ATP-dependent protease ClpP protease subunit